MILKTQNKEEQALPSLPAREGPQAPPTSSTFWAFWKISHSRSHFLSVLKVHILERHFFFTWKIKYIQIAPTSWFGSKRAEQKVLGVILNALNQVRIGFFIMVIFWTFGLPTSINRAWIPVEWQTFCGFRGNLSLLLIHVGGGCCQV